MRRHRAQAMADPVADALKPVLNQFDLDEDTIESLEEIVRDAHAEGPELGARELATRLEEALEPFLLAFGAEPGSVPGSAFQVAVSLRGLPAMEGEVRKAAAAPVVEEVKLAPKDNSKEAAAPFSLRKSAKQAAAPKAQGREKAAGAKEPSSEVSLLDLCAKGLKEARNDTDGYPKDTAAAGGPPKSLASLWAAKGDTLAEAAGSWNAKPSTLGAGAEVELSDKSDEEEDEESAAGRKARERKQQKEDSRSKRVARSEALVNAIGASEMQEELGDIAAHGLRESRDEEGATGGAKAKQRSRGARGVHVEGANSRNIHLEGVNITLTGEQGSKDVLLDAELHLSAGHVYGLCGKNGSGKTTLLRRLALGTLPGMSQTLRLGYVAQELAALKDQQSAVEAVVEGDEERRELLKEREEIELALAGSEGLRDKTSLAEAEARAGRFSEIEQRLVFIDADGAEARAEQALSWLSFDDAMMRRPVQELSGGWRMRLALARVLCSRPDVLLLDEPTNHLDLHGVLWLQDHLRREWGADAKKRDRIVVAVSHDRAFLDACATDIIEILDCKLRVFPGNYSNYVERVADEQRLVLLRKDEAAKEEKVARIELKNMKKAARSHGDEKKVRQLKSKEKKVEQGFKLSSAREFGGDGDDIVTKLREDTNLRFKFPEVEEFIADDTNLLEMDAATIRIGSTPILKKVTLTIAPTSRVAIVGGNGSGKSTLMRALAGELKADEGTRGRGRKHPAWKPGFVSQNHLESQANGLHDNCIGYMRELLPEKSKMRGDCLTKDSDDTSIRAHLGNFGMGKDALKKVGYLSGGQKARLSLSATTWWKPGALLLDEPTNHLDVDSLDALTLGLQAYEGPVIVVSHNRGFLEALCDELWIVKGGSVTVCPKGDEAFSTFFASYVKECQAAIKH